VDCRLCKGSGRYRQDDCPECGGDGKIDRRYADEIDMSKYKEVTCPLCNGKATFRGETCPACDGEGKLESRFADTIDKNDYI
jgi:DnaJ-class molecular chaperone